MRFFARLAIAIATLISSALLCWGQSPSDSPGGASTIRPASARATARPSLTPPKTVEGIWVSDDEPAAAPGALPAAPDLSPFDAGNSTMQDVAPPEASGFAAGDGPEFGGDCDDGCDDGYGPPGRYCPPVTGSLWNEVHAHRRTWFEVDYLSFWAKGNQLPPLVTTSPIGTPQSQAGVLPESATTAILFGNQRVDQGQRNGGRIRMGYWLIDGEFLGVEGEYFTFDQQGTTFNAASNFTGGGGPNDIILARPFFNVDPNLPNPREDAALVAFPNFISGNFTGDLNGGIHIRTSSNIQSACADLRKLVWIDFTRQRRLDLLLGYRFLRIDDSVNIDDTSTFTGGQFNDVTFTSQDIFSTKNRFHGGEIGLKGQSYHGRLSLEGVAKVAFGNNTENVYINGSNTVTTLGVTTPGVGGLLAQPTNIGSYRRDVFAIVPEANGSIKFDVTRNMRLTLGYTFIYINRAQRSGEAIDRTLNPTQIGGTLVGEARPAFHFTDTAYWLHGVNGGFEYRW